MLKILKFGMLPTRNDTNNIVWGQVWLLVGWQREAAASTLLLFTYFKLGWNSFSNSKTAFVFSLLEFIYSEKATKFCEISTVDLSYAVPVKYTVETGHFAKFCSLLRIYEFYYNSIQFLSSTIKIWFSKKLFNTKTIIVHWQKKEKWRY